MSVLKVGVIGLGDISDKYINNLKLFPEDVELLGCACRSLEKAEKKKAEFGFKKAYASGEDLINDPEVDIVLNLTIPEFHYHYNIMALKAGKHVYTEKPLAGTFEEGKELYDCAKDKGLYLGSAPDTFMGGRLQTVRKLIDEGKVGDIIGGSVSFLSHGTEWFHPDARFFYQPGGGAALDIGPYYVTALVSLMGPAKSVYSVSAQPFKVRKYDNDLSLVGDIEVHPDVDTHYQGVINFENGAAINFAISWDVWDSKAPRIELYGTESTISIIDDEDQFAGPNIFGGTIFSKNKETYRWKFMPPREEYTSIPWSIEENHHQYNSVSYTENNRGIGLVDMVQSIKSGKPNRASGEMALHVLEILSSIVKGGREGKIIELKTTCSRPKPLGEKGL